MCKHRLASATFRIGAVMSATVLPCAVFVRAWSASQRVFWDVSKFYELLGMKSYSGIPSKLIHDRSGGWKKTFNAAFGSDQICFSTFVHEKAVRRQAMPFSSRCLPFVGVSSAGVLLLLTKWAFTERYCRGAGRSYRGAATCIARCPLRDVRAFDLGQVGPLVC